MKIYTKTGDGGLTSLFGGTRVSNALAVAQDHLTTLDRVQQIVRLSGYVASSPEFHQQPLIINGASELLEAIFGAAGKHSRIAVGVISLPLNAPVELDLILQFTGWPRYRPPEQRNGKRGIHNDTRNGQERGPKARGWLQKRRQLFL